MNTLKVTESNTLWGNVVLQSQSESEVRKQVRYKRGQLTWPPPVLWAGKKLGWAQLNASCQNVTLSASGPGIEWCRTGDTGAPGFLSAGGLPCRRGSWKVGLPCPRFGCTLCFDMGTMSSLCAGASSGWVDTVVPSSGTLTSGPLHSTYSGKKVQHMIRTFSKSSLFQWITDASTRHR